MDDRQRIVLYDQRQLSLILDGMARRVAGLLGDRPELVIVGVLRRGAPLAELLGERLQRLGINAVQRLDLQVKRYADDLTLLFPETRLTESATDAGLHLTGKSVLIVDDVLYRGHSLLRVVQYLALRGPATIRSAILVDRSVSALPVHADVAGVTLQVAPGSIVEVHVPPYETDFGIELVVPRPV